MREREKAGSGAAVVGGVCVWRPALLSLSHTHVPAGRPAGCVPGAKSRSRCGGGGGGVERERRGEGTPAPLLSSPPPAPPPPLPLPPLPSSAFTPPPPAWRTVPDWPPGPGRPPAPAAGRGSGLAGRRSPRRGRPRGGGSVGGVFETMREGGWAGRRRGVSLGSARLPLALPHSRTCSCSSRDCSISARKACACRCVGVSAREKSVGSPVFARPHAAALKKTAHPPFSRCRPRLPPPSLVPPPLYLVRDRLGPQRLLGHGDKGLDLGPGDEEGAGGGGRRVGVWWRGGSARRRVGRRGGHHFLLRGVKG